MIFNEKLETMGPEQLRNLQSERLRATVRRMYDRVAPYRKKMDAIGLTPGDIRSMDDLSKLPFTVKDDLRDAYPFGMFAEPMDNIVRVHSSSGTTGKPTVVGYTHYDVHEIWAEVMARTIGCANGTPQDIVHVAYGYGLFTGGLGVHYGAERLGATVIPISGGNTKRQIMIMQDFGSTILACTPSYSLYIADVCDEMGIRFRDLKIKSAILGAEPWTNEMRDEIEARLGVLAIDIYGLSEIIGPGVSSECPEKCGLHVNEDHFYPEIIDPETGKVLPDGQRGELVFTCITKEALPLIRYRTRDISALSRGKCGCGRTFVRMERVSGRTDDMLIIRGVNVFPSQIESVLVAIEGTEPHYEIVVDKSGALDELEIRVEVNPALFSDEVKGLEALRDKIQNEIESVLGITAAVKLVEPRAIARSEGKAKRVIDKRKMQ
ncbi:phenylacetate--CoA ligase [Candidatus Sumerlaeota bacterium]|nr:phenylacetate--CoA ligase [Candidatus Sumerlaeota bacterium]